MTITAKRIALITGGSGFLGRHCLSLLMQTFDEVHATTTRNTPRDPPGVHWHQIDLLHSPSVVELVGRVRPTHLLHLAWVTEHGSFWNSPENSRWLNASIRLVLAFAAWGGQRVVTAGTCAEYDWQFGHCHETRTACAPATLYGACKHALRLAVQSIDGLSAAHTRIFHLFGPAEDPRRLTPSVVDALLAGDRPACTHGRQLRDFLYVKDATAAHVKLLDSQVNGTVNVASGQAITIRDYVQSIGRKLGAEERIDFGAIPTSPHDPPVLTADVTRLREVVGFSPEYSLTSGLEETIRCLQSSRHISSAAAEPRIDIRRELTQDNIALRSSAQKQPQSNFGDGTRSVPATNCPLCDCADTVRFLRRDNVPVHQNLVMRDAASARAIARGTLAMHACPDCGFVFNAAFDPSLLSYGEAYDNSQTCSPAFREYVDELVQHLIHQRGVRGKRIVEVGCGKGDFLRRLVSDAEADNCGWGFDPTYVGPDEELNGRLTFQRNFYDAACAESLADVLICRHVIEHVRNPCDLLRNMRQAGGQVFVETPCIRWIFRNEVVWDLFYEHCSLFTVESLRQAIERSGYQVNHARHVFGGQYLWLEASPWASLSETRNRDSENRDQLVSQAIKYGNAEQRLVGQWSELVQHYATHGGACVWGAGAKGVTLANLVDPTAELIDCVVDLNPAKQGRFLAGTGHAIIAPEQLAARNVTHALVLNPNYVREIQRLLASIAPHMEVVDLSELTAIGKRAA